MTTSSSPAVPPSSVVPPSPAAALTIFGNRLSLAERFAGHLADTGISHGLIGPREVPRLWDRHILNCAVIAQEMPEGSSVIDVGSGAGLPGIALAIARPDLSVTLVEPMERRTQWLETVAADLALDNVSVTRARAEEMHTLIAAEIVTARAVAALDRLARWCLPLVSVGGRLVAMKGSSAEREIDASRSVVRRLGGGEARVQLCGTDVLETPTTVVVIEKVADPARAPRSSRRSAERVRRPRTDGSGRTPRAAG